MTSGTDAIDDLVPALDQAISDTETSGTELIPASRVLEDLRLELVRRIDMMLSHQRSLLMSTLYRVDVAEGRVIEALSTLPREEIPHRLADLIIERQVQKVRSRRASRTQDL